MTQYNSLNVKLSNSQIFNLSEENERIEQVIDTKYL